MHCAGKKSRLNNLTDKAGFGNISNAKETLILYAF
jgi:hypothetical protein